MKMRTKLALGSAAATVTLGVLLVGNAHDEDRLSIWGVMALFSVFGYMLSAFSFLAGESEASERERKRLLEQHKQPDSN